MFVSAVPHSFHTRSRNPAGRQTKTAIPAIFSPTHFASVFSCSQLPLLFHLALGNGTVPYPQPSAHTHTFPMRFSSPQDEGRGEDEVVEQGRQSQMGISAVCNKDRRRNRQAHNHWPV